MKYKIMYNSKNCEYPHYYPSANSIQSKLRNKILWFVSFNCLVPFPIAIVMVVIFVCTSFMQLVKLLFNLHFEHEKKTSSSVGIMLIASITKDFL